MSGGRYGHGLRLAGIGVFALVAVAAEPAAAQSLSLDLGTGEGETTSLILQIVALITSSTSPPRARKSRIGTKIASIRYTYRPRSLAAAQSVTARRYGPFPLRYEPAITRR